MQKIQSIENDIKTAQKCVIQSRENTKILDIKMKYSLIKLSALYRKQNSLKRINEILKCRLKNCILQYRSIQDSFKKCMLNNAYEASNALKIELEKLLETSKRLKSPSLIIIEQLKSKVEHIEDDIKIGIEGKISRMLCKFSKEEYGDLSKYYEVHFNWKSSDHTLHPLFEAIRTECNKVIKMNFRRIIVNTEKRIKLKDLCKKIDIHKFVDMLNEIFKFHASMMYSHHLIISFHERKHARLKQEEMKLQKDGTIKKQGIGFHQAIKALLMDDRRNLWSNLQLKVSKIFTGIQDKLTQLSIPEIFEILSLCAKYLSIGEEFSGVSSSE